MSRMKFSQNTVMSVSDDSQEPGKSWARMGRFRYPPHRSQICCPADLSHLRHPIAKFRKSVESASVYAKNAYMGRRSKAPLILKNDTRVRTVKFEEVKQRLF